MQFSFRPCRPLSITQRPHKLCARHLASSILIISALNCNPASSASCMPRKRVKASTSSSSRKNLCSRIPDFSIFGHDSLHTWDATYIKRSIPRNYTATPPPVDMSAMSKASPLERKPAESSQTPASPPHLREIATRGTYDQFRMYHTNKSESINTPLVCRLPAATTTLPVTETQRTAPSS